MLRIASIPGGLEARKISEHLRPPLQCIEVNLPRSILTLSPLCWALQLPHSSVDIPSQKRCQSGCAEECDWTRGRVWISLTAAGSAVHVLDGLMQVRLHTDADSMEYSMFDGSNRSFRVDISHLLASSRLEDSEPGLRSPYWPWVLHSISNMTAACQ